MAVDVENETLREVLSNPLLPQRLQRPGDPGFTAGRSCLGERHFDLAGYPYDSEEDAHAADWDRLAQDASEAADKLKNEIG
jgi:hypothetical protein